MKDSQVGFTSKRMNIKEQTITILKRYDIRSTDSCNMGSTDSCNMGSTDSCNMGSTDSCNMGSTDSCNMGSTDSCNMGSTDSCNMGSTDSCNMGSTDSSNMGSTDSCNMGSTDSSNMGSTDSCNMGSTDSSNMGSTDSCNMGSTDSSNMGSTDSCNMGSTDSCMPSVPRAAVLIPLFQKDGGLHVLMTLRSLELRSNAGEVCFPGGKRDPGDRDDVATALREAEEEIGLPPEEVEVVCSLFPVFNKTGLLVTPVVGFIDESFVPVPNPAEVSSVFTVPLEFFIKAEAHSAYSPTGRGPLLHSFLYQEPQSGLCYQVWGLTAMFAILVASLAFQIKPQFDVGFDFDNPSMFFHHNLNKMISKL